jgi:glycosyltransferase involved in cell wall biosynthesis
MIIFNCRRKVAIVYHAFLNLNGSGIKVGGVETYIVNLARVLKSEGYDPFVIQNGDAEWVTVLDDLTVFGVVPPSYSYRASREHLFRFAMSKIDLTVDLLIFAADHVSVPQKLQNCISIQHGISWDVRSDHAKFEQKFTNRAVEVISRTRAAFRGLRDFENCINRVCVDHNFLNWYRAHPLAKNDGTNWVIPNFASLGAPPPVRRVNDDALSLIFARRFVVYRGTSEMVSAIKILWTEFPLLTITFAGEGPEEQWMRSELAGDPRAKFVRYEASEAKAIHADHEIALVPSLGSEGTSLAVIEAMAAGCAVIASPVGGITNLIIDDFNGLLVNPSAQNLASAVKSLINDPLRRRRLQENALSTVTASLSFDTWAERWCEVVSQVRTT